MMYKGSNAEWLHNMCLYDLLCSIGDNLGICIIEGITGAYYPNNKGICNEDCENCIAEWLNEPHEGGTNGQS